MNHDNVAASNELPQGVTTAVAHEAAIESGIGEALTDEQLLQMADRDSSWGANCSKGSC